MDGVSGRNSVRVGASQHDKQHQNAIMGFGKGTDANTLTFEVPKNFKPNSKFKVYQKKIKQIETSGIFFVKIKNKKCYS